MMGLLSVIWLLALFIVGLCHGALRPESELSSSCYDFPAQDFSPVNCIQAKFGTTPKVQLEVGSKAIEFTLSNANGEKMTLSSYLEKAPVVMIWGMPTCAAFRGYLAENRYAGAAYGEENNLYELLKGKITILHIISSEPHPTWPYTNFDKGTIRINLWSTIKQPQTFAERLNLSLAPVQRVLNSDIEILIDDLDETRSNPVWCSYANAARAALLISQDGEILYTQDWFDGPDMYSQITTLYEL